MYTHSIIITRNGQKIKKFLDFLPVLSIYFSLECQLLLEVKTLIMPIKDLRNTTEISNIAHKEQEPIFITKNGYSDLVVMSSELYDKFAKMNRIDQAIFESEQEIANGAEAVDAEIVFAELEKKHFG